MTHEEKILAQVPWNFCHCCAVERHKRGEGFKALTPYGKTERKRLFIGRCEDCDGPPVEEAVA